MSNKVEQSEEQKMVAAATLPPVSPSESKSLKICITCQEKPTISPSCPYCGSCMNKKSREAQKGKNAPISERQKRAREDKAPAEKTPSGQNLAVSIDFEKHRHVLKQVQDLADQEIRPLDLEIIFLLKCHFDKEALSK